MPVQRICSPARRTDSARLDLQPSEIQQLTEMLQGLHDALADMSDRLHVVEVHLSEREPSHALVTTACTRPHIPAPARVQTPSRHWSLRDLRHARGWSQAGLRCRIYDIATAQGLRLPAPAVMKTMVSRWENGASISEFYGAILDRILPEAAASTAFELVSGVAA